MAWALLHGPYTDYLIEVEDNREQMINVMLDQWADASPEKRDTLIMGIESCLNMKDLVYVPPFSHKEPYNPELHSNLIKPKK